MYSAILNRKRSIFTLLIFLFISLFFFSCKKNIDNDVDPGITVPDLSIKVNSSVSGFVTDHDNNAVPGAAVKVGSISITTDSYGFFEVKNVQVSQQAAVVTVERSGFFKGIKTYIATEGRSAFFRIKLIPKTIAGTVNASAGGNVTLSNGLTISLPAGGVVNAATGTAYAGEVRIAASWINPTASDLHQVMPGDLRGIDNSGSLKSLKTFGMAAVELTGLGGESLQIAPGRKATLTMPLPAEILAAAPATIPLWFFDEAAGLWKEEGTATKTGNTYIGEVSHFSFWNCDTPNSYIQFDCRVLDGNGQPVPFAIVKLSVVGDPYNMSFGYTDSSGYVSGPVPDNAQLSMNIYASYECGNVVYSQNFSTGSINLSLGSININTANSTANVTGTVTNCGGSPVTNGYIIMLKNNLYYRYDLNSSGAFDFNALLCSGGNPAVTFIAEDNASGLQSGPLNYGLVTGANNVGNLQACSVSSQQFLNYSINGTNYSYASPADSFFHYIDPQLPSEMAIAGQQASPAGGYGGYSFTSAGIGAGNQQDLTNIYFSQVQSDSLRITTPIAVNITEYGSVGQFIAGNFVGVFTGLPPANTSYTVTSNFRVRRLQ